MSNATFTSSVSVREESVVIPTYSPAPPDPNPMFLERRVNQGASGRVYPMPLTDRISNDKQDREYQAVYLENEYLDLMLLPEIGGRLHAARDKTNGYDFIYRQHVVKPAFIGLCGPWLSGGMEFNWPLHHRPSTFMPIAYQIERGADGSCTVWMGENEPLERTRGLMGVCLRPGRALIEIKVRLYNRTPLPRSFLWWVNIAVLTHAAYQVIFPPDVWAVTDHSKRAMSHYPVSRERYYGVEFEQGVDVSWYRNTPVPASYFVWDTAYDFFGGYDHNVDAGVVHVADRHIAPGKKFFTWGTEGPAKAWERNLTDADGQYLELMAGVYTDNQPDFSWLQPFEVKTFSQYLYPVQSMGPPHNANTRAAVHLEVADGTAAVGVCSTESLTGVQVALEAHSGTVWQRQVDLAPDLPLRATAPLPSGVAPETLRLVVRDAEGTELIAYRPESIDAERELPEPKKPAPPPEEIGSVEELYLTGLHVEQYRSPTLTPEAYWEAALKQEPGDARTNNAMGLLHLRRGDLQRAVDHFQRAIQTLTLHNFNPRDGEPYYNLGLALRYLGRLDEAYEALYKAIWSYAWQTAGYYALAELDCQKGNWDRALEHLALSLRTNTEHHKAHVLRATVFRYLGRLEQARAELEPLADVDALDPWPYAELELLARRRGDNTGAAAHAERLQNLLCVGDPLLETQNYMDLALDYAAAGFLEEGCEMLERAAQETGSAGRLSPMVRYCQGWLRARRGDQTGADRAYAEAAKLSPEYVFPERVEEMLALQDALARQPQDARAHCYLANLLYDKQRPEAAIGHWEESVRLEPELGTCWRNLGIAYYNVRQDGSGARECYRHALAARPKDGRILCEYDQLLGRLGTPADQRLAVLDERADLVAQRDDLTLSRITLCNRIGDYEEALKLAASRRFIPWEGGEGRVSDQYVEARLQLGRAALASGAAAEALEHFDAARSFPENLGEGRSPLRPPRDIDYYRGLAYQAMSENARARECFAQACEGRDRPSDMTYYYALAERALGRDEEACERLAALRDHAERQRDTELRLGFATSIPRFVFEAEDPVRRRRLHAHYLLGLAHAGLGDSEEARQAFRHVLEMDPWHVAARQQLEELK